MIRKRQSWTSMNPGSQAPGAIFLPTTEVDKEFLGCVHKGRWNSLHVCPWTLVRDTRRCVIPGCIRRAKMQGCVYLRVCVQGRVLWKQRVIIRDLGSERHKFRSWLATSCVILGKSVNLSEPQSPLPDMGIINGAYLLRLLRWINEKEVA